MRRKRGWSSKRAPQIVEVAHADGALLLEARGPGEPGPLEARIEDEELPSFVECRAGLGQGPGRVARFDNHGRLGEGAHRDVALGKEVAVLWRLLLAVP